MTDETTTSGRTPASFEGADLQGATFHRSDLTGARLRAVDFSGVVIRGSDVTGTEIDSPWLLEGGNTLHVNGIDVVPLVDAELDRRFPGRSLRRAADPEGLRSAWAALEAAWDAVLARAEGMPDGTADASVGGEWSLAQTLRHLVMATDTWLGRAIERVEQPFHPIGQPDTSYGREGNDPSVFSPDTPTWAEVLEVRAGHMARVRDVLATITPEQLAEARQHPWGPRYPETVLSCLRTILEEEWEHLRYAVRDLDALSARATEDPSDPQA